MAVVRYDPFRELFQVSNSLNHFFSRRPSAHQQEELGLTAWPAVDIFEDAEGITLTAELPGLDPKAVEVKLENQTLTLSGERKLEREDKRDQYHRVESWSGAFARSFTLPNTVDLDKIKAEHKNGLLKVFLPRKEETKPRQVKIKVEA
jgi:HSP20 family protein